MQTETQSSEGPQNLLPIMQGPDGQAVSARALYAFLYPEDGMAHFTRWAADKISGNEFAERGYDWEVLSNPGENPLGGRPAQDFAIRLDFAKKLAMMARSDRGEMVRAYFLQCESQAKLNQLYQAFPQIPRTYHESLRALADVTEAHEKMLAQIEAQKPAVEYAERIAGTVNACTIDQAAKESGFPVKAFRDWVHAKYCFKRNGEWWPREEYGPNGKGWFSIRTGSWTSRSGQEVASHTVLMTGEGRMRIGGVWQAQSTEEVQ